MTWRYRCRPVDRSSAGARPACLGANAPKIDYKDVKLLQRYVSERGKIVPRASPRFPPRSSASRAIKRAGRPADQGIR
jgi:ribosomal protein S18